MSDSDTHHGMFVATCEKCGDGVALTRDQQSRFIGLRGEFVCGPCGGMRPKTTMARRVVPRPPRPRAPKPKTEAPPKPKETGCCLKGQEPPTYFRPCPGCPAGLR